jgi:hypothetical protein
MDVHEQIGQVLVIFPGIRHRQTKDPCEVSRMNVQPCTPRDIGLFQIAPDLLGVGNQFVDIEAHEVLNNRSFNQIFVAIAGNKIFRGYSIYFYE